ncbi:cysteine-rich CWC family protein [Roseateles sp. BYS180W]|uniref:Cysteine-rich CWC family protein n=1 Tax=Roseateles rivi TaxID=3299028 RepID=A0ABW7FR75_9BURK
MSTTPAPQALDRCPRCGQAFHCGVQDSHCDCQTLTLTPALRAELAQRWPGACLCLRCLRELSTGQVPPA